MRRRGDVLPAPARPAISGHSGGGPILLHGIAIRAAGTFDLLPKGDPGQPLEHFRLEQGEVILCEVRCYVTDGLTEVADIALADGTGVLRAVPCHHFHFLDRAPLGDFAP